VRDPLFKCLFCELSSGPFEHTEHPIPESLGNDEILLPRGFVCDPCNQYFGAKLEAKILASPPFAVERTGQAIKTKKGKLARYDSGSISLCATGYWDTVFLACPPAYFNTQISGARLAVAAPPSYGNLLSRFLLKVGMELLLLTNEVDPYGDRFGAARKCARYGDGVQDWDVAYGISPHRDHLKLSSRCDEFGPLETRQIYQYEIGIMPRGDVVLSFVFVNHVFACNLSRPPLTEYLLGFNANNEFSLTSRWNRG
jgi:hypothetical protein